ncbi:MAG: NfeD family protein [Opitutaceae bacterium]|nr:NfeD family protein [Opitutaceae bacterium]
MIVLLFIVGTLLLAGEILLPGGIAGTIGGAALLAGCWLAFSTYGSSIGTVATLAACALVALTLYLELVWLPRTKMGRTMVVEATIDSRSQPPPADAAMVVGQPAVALTTLAPSGYVSVGGKQYEAYCRSGHAARGANLSVVGVDNFQLIVSEIKNS